ncbi:Hint domain-containing protein [Streptomyces sp. NPDC001443]
MGCINTALTAVPWGKVFKAIKVGVEAFKVWRSLDRAYTAVKDAEEAAKVAEDAVEAERFLVEAEKTESAGAEAAGCVTHSFTPGTAVRLADGSSKPIGQVETGDEVLATDPQTGVSAPEKVQNVIVTTTDRDFTTLTLDAHHTAGSATSSQPTETSAQALTTTWHHPFWDATHHRWTDAHLRTTDGTIAVVRTVRNFHQQQTTYDLTVNNLHTYYVLAGAAPVLVHNVNEDSLCNVTLGSAIKGRKAEGVTAERGDTALAHEQRMMNEFGDRNGCASCGAAESGYKDGHWTGDHNPPNKLAPNGPWTLYPHCKACSKQQGGIVRTLLKEYYDFPVWKP